jgi:hypothetical protein
MASALVIRISALLSSLAYFATRDAELGAVCRETLEKLVTEYMPSGSGLDRGTQLLTERSGPEKLVFVTAFHHMTEHGYYDGWTDHIVTVTPAFDGSLYVRVSGRNRNGIKDVIADTFTVHLRTEVGD